MDELPVVMLGIRSAWRLELDKAPCELVFGTTLVVPGSFFDEKVDREAGFVEDLKRSMSELRPTQMAHHANAKINLPDALEKTAHVFIRTDAVRPPLVRPYTGPFKVLSKEAKYFTVLKNGKPDKISIDRLKPAFLQDNNMTDDVMRRAGNSNDNHGVRNKPVVPGQKRARGRPRKRGCETRKKNETKIKTKDVMQRGLVITRSGRTSRQPDRS